MKKRQIYLLLVVIGSLLSSVFVVTLERKVIEVGNPEVSYYYSNEEYFFSFLIVLIWVIIPSFIIGIVFWGIFRNRQPDKLFYVIFCNVTAISIFLFLNLRTINNIRITSAKRELNREHNEYLTKSHGGYLDTCMMLVQQDIIQQGTLPNKFRITFYRYDEELTTIPRDTTNKYYNFQLTYAKVDGQGHTTMRAAKYSINFNHNINRIYDVDISDEKAKPQREAEKELIKMADTAFNQLPKPKY